MLRRALALSLLFVLVTAALAVAGQMPLSDRLIDSAGWRRGDLPGFGGPPPLHVDETGDVYHPSGSPGLTFGTLDIAAVSTEIWAVGLGDLLDDNPFNDPTSPFDAANRGVSDLTDGHVDGPDDEEWDFSLGSPYVIAEFELALDVRYDDEFFCEYPWAWRNPMYDAFNGIDGDLFNGANYVTVVRTGAGVPGGFQVASLEFMDGAWMEVPNFGYGAAVDNRVVLGVPANHFGPAGEAITSRFTNFARSTSLQAADPVPMNFGAFCSEGGQSFDPDIGGVDILVQPIDLSALPVRAIGPTPEESPVTTTAPSTTVASTTVPVTSVPPEEQDEGGGMNPALIALIVGGVGGAAWGAMRAMRQRDDAKRPPGFSVRLDLDSGASATFSDIAGLPFEPTPIDYRDGSETGSPSIKQPGIPKYANITMKRGFTATPELFHEWSKGVELGSGSVGLFIDEQRGGSWKWDTSWITKVDGPGLKTTGNEAAMESLELKIENPRFEAGP
jgi:phage tail-like protein